MEASKDCLLWSLYSQPWFPSAMDCDMKIERINVVLPKLLLISALGQQQKVTDGVKFPLYEG